MNAIITQLTAMHDITACANDHVWEVWNDGEVTVTKGGDIYEQRRRFTRYPGDSAVAVPQEQWPQEFRRGDHARIVVQDEAAALRARELIFCTI